MTIAGNKRAMSEIEKVSKKYTKMVENNIVVRDNELYSIRINGKYIVECLKVKTTHISPETINRTLKNDLNDVLKKLSENNQIIQLEMNTEIWKIWAKYK